MGELFIAFGWSHCSNPGLAHFPCTVCTRPVRAAQHGIQCDGCNE